MSRKDDAARDCITHEIKVYTYNNNNNNINNDYYNKKLFILFWKSKILQKPLEH